MTTPTDEIAEQIRRAAEEARRKRTEESAAEAPKTKAKASKNKRDGTIGIYRQHGGWVERAIETAGDDGQIRATWRRVCTALEVAAMTRDADGRDWGRLLRVTDRDGQVHEWAAPASLFAGSGEVLRAELLSLGLELAPDRNAKTWLAEYILGNAAQARARCVTRIGWHDGRFVLPDGAIGGANDGETLLLQTPERLDHAFNVKGSLEAWREGVAAPALGTSRLILALASAFAGPLLALGEDEGGGFHFRGASSTGKSTCLSVASSVWGGGGIRGAVRQWRATDNALESIATTNCDALLCLDELAQVEPKAAGQAAYLLSNGRGKARAGRDGAARRVAEWRVLFLSTGEIGLADKIAESAGGRIAAGMEARLVDIAADAGAGLGIFEDLHGGSDAALFAQSLKAASMANYGQAARAFLEVITADLDAVGQFVTKARRAFVDANLSAGVDGQVRRVADRFALVAAAGELASALGITGWPEQAAAQGCARCLADWIRERGGTGSAETAEALRRLRAFIDANARSRFESWQGESGRAIIIARAGYVRRDIMPDGTHTAPEFYLLPSAFTSEVLAGLDARHLGRELVAAGALVPDKAGNPTAVYRVPTEGGRPTRLYRISASWLGAEGDD